jgi:hypothetical protein
MSQLERREEFRVPLQIPLHEYVNDQPFCCISANLSVRGLYLKQLVQVASGASRVVGLEFELPGTGEVIWASGKQQRESFGSYFQGTGIRFASMARAHERLIKDWVFERRTRELQKLLATIKRNRMYQ